MVIQRLTGKTAILAYPFRIFFLLTAVFGAVVIAGWIAMLESLIPLPPRIAPNWWHAHEMLYGFVPAAAAGFLLTAMPNWTGVAPPRGIALLALASLWLAGRLAMLGFDDLPAWAAALVDMAFLPTLAAICLRMLVIGGNRRNLPIPGVLLALAGGNGLMHAAFMGWAPAMARPGELVALDLIALLIAIIGGRITPAFTRNWLERHSGDRGLVRTWPWLEWSALASLVALAIADLVAPRGPAVAVIAGTAAALHLGRLILWRGWLTRSDALLWILHVGYAWLPIAFGLRALDAIGVAGSLTGWMHALGVGAMGTMILGVMARVSVAHTGRGLILQPEAGWIFALVTLGAVLRLVAGFGVSEGALHGAAIAWVGAFALFVASYGPVLWRPRIDGKPG